MHTGRRKERDWQVSCTIYNSLYLDIERAPALTSTARDMEDLIELEDNKRVQPTAVGVNGRKKLTKPVPVILGFGSLSFFSVSVF